jgi:MFS transporter, CP family, cyanate transporter
VSEVAPRHTLGRFATLWCVGFTLRLTVLVVPPLTTRIQADLGLSQAGLGALATMPVLLLAVGAPVGAAVASRLGPRVTLLVALVVVAVASGSRGAAGTFLLFALTLLMGLAIATAQPAMPDLVQGWAPRRAGRATAIWVNGMLVGEVLAASLTLPVVLPLAGGDWRVALALWSVPVLAVALLVGVVRGRSGDGAPAPRTRRRWLPDWRSGVTWRLGLVQGASSVIYFGVNAYLASYLNATGHPGLVAVALTVLNAAQLPATVMLALLPNSVTASRTFIASLGLSALAGLIVMVSGPAPAVLVGAAVAGFVAGAGVTVAFTLPVLVASRDDVHRVSAGMLSIGYTLAFLLPLLGGMAWDLTDLPILGFLPAFVSAAGLFVLALTMHRRGPAR